MIKLATARSLLPSGASASASASSRMGGVIGAPAAGFPASPLREAYPHTRGAIGSRMVPAGSRRAMSPPPPAGCGRGGGAISRVGLSSARQSRAGASSSCPRGASLEASPLSEPVRSAHPRPNEGGAGGPPGEIAAPGSEPLSTALWSSSLAVSLASRALSPPPPVGVRSPSSGLPLCDPAPSSAEHDGSSVLLGWESLSIARGAGLPPCHCASLCAGGSGGAGRVEQQGKARRGSGIGGSSASASAGVPSREVARAPIS